MILPPADAHTLARLLTAQTVNGELALMSDAWRPLATLMEPLSAEARQIAWKGAMALRTDRDAIIRAVADRDPLGPPPSEIATIQFATAADLHQVETGTRWVWDGWIPAACVVGVASPEGVGKTRLALDISRRVWNQLPWPDGQPMTSAQAPTLWLCADGHHHEIAEAMPALGLPNESIIFPAPSSDPYANTSLDASETWDWLTKAIASVRPAFTFIDTLTYATSLDLCEQRTVAKLKGPLVDLVQTHQCNIVLLLHVSKEGQALGRRIKGVTRSLIHLEAPDPDQPAKLRLWVEKTYGKKPPPLGLSIGESGNIYNSSPPAPRDQNRGGRPPVKLDKAISFLEEKLAEGDCKAIDLINEWLALGEFKGTIFDAKKRLEAEGRLVVDAFKKPQWWHMVKRESV